MRFSLLLWSVALLSAQDPYQLAPANYHLEFENDWVRISRVKYQPGDKIAVHDHPAVNTVYVYVTDGGPIRFGHQEFEAAMRPAVKAGAVRYARGFKETHDTTYLGDTASEYLRVELRTVHGGARNARIPADSNEPIDNAQVRIERVDCRNCAPSGRPSVVVDLDQRTGKFVAAGEAAPAAQRALRIVLKTEREPRKP